MDTELHEKLVRMTARREQFLRRAARMLAAADRNQVLPEDALFSEHELKSLDDNSSDIAVEILGSVPPSRDWRAPVSFAYSESLKERSDRMHWLRKFQEGLRLSKRFFESFVTTGSREVHVGDRYTAQQAGAMGPGAHAHDMTFELDPGFRTKG